jgi:hypothetical protein
VFEGGAAARSAPPGQGSPRQRSTRLRLLYTAQRFKDLQEIGSMLANNAGKGVEPRRQKGSMTALPFVVPVRRQTF